jgi:hypothetical protein
MFFIGYQLLTSHVARLRKWRSFKAYFILNAIEIVFWAAIVYFGVVQATQKCEGVSCTLGYVVTVLGALMR